MYGTTEDPDVWSAGAGARPPPQYGSGPSGGEKEENEKEAPPTPAAPQTTRKTTTKAPTTLRPSPPLVPIAPTAKAFPVYRPMKPPPSLGRPPSDHESLDNFIHSDSRRPGEPITFVRQIVHVLQNAFAPFRPQPTYYIQIA